MSVVWAVEELVVLGLHSGFEKCPDYLIESGPLENSIESHISSHCRNQQLRRIFIELPVLAGGQIGRPARQAGHGHLQKKVSSGVVGKTDDYSQPHTTQLLRRGIDEGRASLMKGLAASSSAPYGLCLCPQWKEKSRKPI